MKKFLRKENGSDLERKKTEREERPEAEVLATEMGVLALALPLVVVAALLPLVVVAELAAALPAKNKNHILICAAAGGRGSSASTLK